MCVDIGSLASADTLRLPQECEEGPIGSGVWEGGDEGGIGAKLVR